MRQRVRRRAGSKTRRGGYVAFMLAFAALLASCAATGAASRAQAAAREPGQTVVSFTFDDGEADQLRAAQVLSTYGMRGTFYIIAGAVGTPGYLTRANLREIAAGGNEIGAHTVSHLDLTKVATAEARRQACMSRDTLTRWGFSVRSFAYPYAAHNPSVEAIVQACGYDSARIGSGLRSGPCPSCTPAESIPPVNPYAIRTPGQVDTSWTLGDLENVITTAERNGGGWVPLVFHDVCSGGSCGRLSIAPDTFAAFAHWLSRRQSLGTIVRTVAKVVNGRDAGEVGVATAGAHGVVNGSFELTGNSGAGNPALESAGPGDLAKCWMRGSYGRNAARWQRTRDAHGGRWAARITTSSHTSGDAKLLQRFDLGACSLPVVAGKSYVLGAWYKSSARTQYAVYYRTSSGRWVYWTSSPYLSPATSWTLATWQTPAVPVGVNGLSFGLALFSVGSLTTDDYSIAPASQFGRAMFLGVVVILIGGAAGLGGLYTHRAAVARAAKALKSRRKLERVRRARAPSSSSSP